MTINPLESIKTNQDVFSKDNNLLTLTIFLKEILLVDFNSILNEISSLVWWCFLTGLIGYIDLKSPKFRVLIDGEPTIIIKRGKIVEKALKPVRLNMDDVSMMLREQNIFSVKDVDYAILEPNGKLSVLKKPDQQNVIRKDMGILVPPNLHMPTEIIVDGNIIKHNLRDLNIDIEWLDNQIKAYGIKSVKEIFYAQLQSDGTLHIDKKGGKTS